MLGLLAAIAGLAAAAFMTIGVDGQWSFAMPLRGGKLATLALCAAAVAVSSVLFQTITLNRLLTPGVMGFDALYVLIQTVLVYFMGSGFVASAHPRLMFLGETAIMLGFVLLLHRWLFAGRRRSIEMLVLLGLVLGVLFRSLSGFLQRLIEPNEFLFLQDRFYASFNHPSTELLLISALAIGGCLWWVFSRLAVFDVLALGRETAINLGVDYRRATVLILLVIGVMVSVSTALVGPVTFFGLLVANLAHVVMRSSRHAVLLPAAILLALAMLVGGQTLLEHVLAFDTNLRVIVDFFGGIAFILILLRRAAP